MFYGPSGTGKTMAAALLAHDIELELYRSDLSRLVTKYIGETEKNLDELFTGDSNDNMILFFDEADALFGMRNKVKDGNDRYANVESKLLIQSFKCFSGIVLLSSNLSTNLDRSFNHITPAMSVSP